MKSLLLLSDVFIPLIVMISITLTNFSLRSVGINNTIVHLTLVFMVFHFLIGRLLSYQQRNNEDVNGFSATVISITALLSLIVIGLPIVRMFTPGHFWVDPMLVSIPVLTLIVLTRTITNIIS